MRIVLGVTMRNEIEYGPHAKIQIEDALSMDYDDIVILDDGSTDGTYELLKEYESKNKRLHVFRLDKNSILDPKGINRWSMLVAYMAQYNPTWINVRAADQIYSVEYRENMRTILEHFLKEDYHVIKFPLVHLWRSKYWMRVDNVWGNDLNHHNKSQVWRFSEKYSYHPAQLETLLHKGVHMPRRLGFADIRGTQINNYFSDKEEYLKIMVLHLGHTTHEKKEAKFRWSMRAASNGSSIGMPPPSMMPHPNRWLVYNGYRGFHEFEVELAPVPKLWFGEDVFEGPLPEIKSFGPVISEYNKQVAREYQAMFNKYIPNRVNKIKEKYNLTKQ